jgi:hypothetical protein
MASSVFVSSVTGDASTSPGKGHQADLPTQQSLQKRARPNDITFGLPSKKQSLTSEPDDENAERAELNRMVAKAERIAKNSAAIEAARKAARKAAREAARDAAIEADFRKRDVSNTMRFQNRVAVCSGCGSGSQDCNC